MQSCRALHTSVLATGAACIPWTEPLSKEGLSVQNGQLALFKRPGLGLDLDPAALKKVCSVTTRARASTNPGSSLAIHTGLGRSKAGSGLSAFRAQGWQFVLFGKDVRIQICDPKFSLLGHAQVAERFGNIGSHNGPEELRICCPEL